MQSILPDVHVQLKGWSIRDFGAMRMTLNRIDQWTGMAMASCPDLLLSVCNALIW